MRRAEMTDPDQQRRSTGGEGGLSGQGDGSSYLKARAALTVYQAQERQLAIQMKKKRTLATRPGRISDSLARGKRVNAARAMRATRCCLRNFSWHSGAEGREQRHRPQSVRHVGRWAMTPARPVRQPN